MPFLGQKKCFLGSGGHFKTPRPYLSGAPLKKGSRKRADSGTPRVKNGHFLPKNGLKMPIWRPKQCSLGSRCQFKGHHPILQVLDPKQKCFAGLGTQKRPRSLKIGHFLHTNGLKMAFWAENSVFRAQVSISRPPISFCRCLTQKTCVVGLGSRKTVRSGPPLLENHHFLPKNDL